MFNKAKKIYYFLVGQILLLFKKIDKKYTYGELFAGRFRGMNSNGWKLLVKCYKCNKKHGTNLDVKWPVSPKTIVVCPQNIEFNPDDIRVFQTPGCYFQAIGKITFGDGCYVGPNVGIITANHSLSNLTEHDTAKPVIIGARCWIGMNAVILPGVRLGDNTVVGAGSVVTKSFERGNCIICGNPAKIIRSLDEETKNDET